MTAGRARRARARVGPRVRRRVGDRAVAVAAGLLLDRALGEPPARWHPVVGLGAVMSRLEARCWADGVPRGGAFAAAGVSLGLLAGTAAARTVPPRPWGGLAVATATCCAGRALRHEAGAVGDLLAGGDLAGARAALPALVGRDPAALDASGVAAAVVESLAENSVDAVVAPAWWGLVAGAPGVAAYRAVNTLDAMVGHRSERYERFGKVAARLDDAANLVPARLTALLVALARPAAAGDVARTVRRDAGAHPSPNAGVAEAAWAGALGRELGGPLRYGQRHEERPRLGRGPRPRPRDVARARRLADDVEGLLVVGLVLLHLATGRAATSRTGRSR